MQSMRVVTGNRCELHDGNNRTLTAILGHRAVLVAADIQGLLISLYKINLRNGILGDVGNVPVQDNPG